VPVPRAEVSMITTQRFRASIESYR